jgi:hypothetical protein
MEARGYVSAKRGVELVSMLVGASSFITRKMVS